MHAFCVKLVIHIKGKYIGLWHISMSMHIVVSITLYILIYHNIFCIVSLAFKNMHWFSELGTSLLWSAWNCCHMHWIVCIQWVVFLFAGVYDYFGFQKMLQYWSDGICIGLPLSVNLYHWLVVIYISMFIIIIIIIIIGIGFEMHVLVAALMRGQCTDIHSLNFQYTIVIGYF